jgi:hypothetical protein
VRAKVFTTLYKMKDSTISSKLQAAFWKSNAESSYRDSLPGDVKRTRTAIKIDSDCIEPRANQRSIPPDGLFAELDGCAVN